MTIRICLNNGVEYKLGSNKEIKWQTLGTFTLLGIQYDFDDDDITALNYRSKHKEFKRILNQWKVRNLSIYGRVCILKSLVLSKLIPLFSAIPTRKRY